MTYIYTPKNKKGHIKDISVDGPYIFLNESFLESYSYAGTGDINNKIEIEKSKINLLDKDIHTYNCYIDNFEKSKPSDSFQFHLKPGNFYTNDHCEYAQPDKLLAISDIEGNFYGLKSILQATNVIDGKYNWTYGSNHVVIVGDLIDRGRDVLPCLWLIYKLGIQAKESGGAVHYLLGNHEVMNLSGDYRYVHNKYSSLPGQPGFDYDALFNSNSILGNWMRTRNSIVKIADYLFVHGGISKELLKSGFSIQQINEITRKHLGKRPEEITHSGERMLFEDDGHLWYRGLIRKDQRYNPATIDDVNRALKYFNVKKIIVGHSKVPFLKTFINGKVLAIDIYQSDELANTPLEALLIDNEKEFIIDDRSNKWNFY